MSDRRSKVLCDDEGKWRFVCASQWDAPDAQVACRQGREGKLINCNKTKGVDRCG